jgi:O-acetyl-ADP-ribose deacetylase
MEPRLEKELRLENGKVLRLVEGDITRIATDAMANAANSALAGGGGVDGAIHRAGGDSIMKELEVIRARDGGCPTGQAVATTAGRLPARFIFHAVGPVYRDGRHGEPELLASCYRACCRLAEENQVRRMSCPSISTGIYGYPIGDAARIALDTLAEHLRAPGSGLEEATFVLFGRAAFEVYAAALQQFGRG